MKPGEDFLNCVWRWKTDVEGGFGGVRDAVEGAVRGVQGGKRTGRQPVFGWGARGDRKMFAESSEGLGQAGCGVFGKPWTGGMCGPSAGVDAQMRNAFFLDGHIVDGAAVGHDGVSGAQAGLAHQIADAMFPAPLFIGGDDHAQRYAGMASMEVGEELEHDGERAFHITGAGAVEAAVGDVRAVQIEVGVFDDVEVADHQDFGVFAVFGKNDERFVATGFVTLEPDAGERFQMIVEEGKGARSFLRITVGAGNEDQIAGEGDEAVGEFGGHGGLRFRICSSTRLMNRNQAKRRWTN